MRNSLTFIVALFLAGIIGGKVLAATDPIKQGGIGGTGTPARGSGIGGTGSPAISNGIGGTGTPALNGGIGGTGLQANNDPTMPTLAGKVLFIVGQVEAQDPGQIRQLSKGDPVRVGDTLKSGKGATLQLRMEDGGTIVLHPESQLVIDTFVYRGMQDGGEQIALTLLTGGFRAVTGYIGNLHKENYSIRTPNAKIGILGTDHETVFVPRVPQGQTAVVEPGTYNHVISGATMLQSEQGNLMIKPNQTGFAPLTGISPIILDRPLPIFGDPNANTEEHGEHHDDPNNSGKKKKDDTGLSDSAPRSEENKLTQTDRLANGSLDINTFVEKDSVPAAPGSAVVGAQMANGLLAVGSVQAGNPGEILLIEEDGPTNYSNNATGFNFNDYRSTLIDSGTAQVDGVNVTWGVYAGGIAFDASGNAIALNFHPFAFANEGATPLTLVSSISGIASFSNMVGYTSPVTESGNLGGSVTLNVGINLGTSTMTSYNLAVVDADSRNWFGTLNGPVALSTFALNGAPLAVSCGGASCGSGIGGGVAAGMLVGPNANGLISSYALSTTSGQAVAGAAIISRP
jgi:hypothetical protein